MSAVILAPDYRDNLIIDPDNPIFKRMRKEKREALRSPNSEDALTWNVFRTLRKLKPATWFPRLFGIAFGSDIPLEPHRMVHIDLWQKLSPPPVLKFHHKEGASEVDILIESEFALWLMEAKYKSDVAKAVTYDPTRDQIIRNLDVGSWHAGVRNFYFSLLIMDEVYSPVGAQLTTQFSSSRDWITARLPHRPDRLSNLRGISLLRWSEMATVLQHCSASCSSGRERIWAG